MGPTTLLPAPRKGVLRTLITLKSSSPSAAFELTNIGSNGKHANYYTTEDGYRIP
jgi:hypothetical protein